MTFDISVPFLLLGVVAGSTYGLLSMGLVLVYRTNRIVNFAHGEIGAFAASVLGVLVVNRGLPYWIVLPIALAIGAATSVAVEVAVVRRLSKVPRVMTVIATLGVAQILLSLESVVFSSAREGAVFPQPPGLPAFDFGGLRVTQAYSAMLFLTPVVVVALTLFLRRSRWGRSLRAASANPDAARLAGIFATRMSSLAWAIAGALSAYTAVLIFPTRGFVAVEAFGPALVLRALAAGVIARMSSLPVAMGAGIAIGLLEHQLFWNGAGGGFVEAVLFVIVVVGLLLQPRREVRGEEKGSWAAVASWRPHPASYQDVWLIRNLGRLVSLVALAVAVTAPVYLGFGSTVAVTTMFAFAITGLSLGVITGLAGQLSLGQFALAGVGAIAALGVVNATGNIVLGVLASGAVAALTSVVIGLPALRIRGLMLAVTTLSFALAAYAWLLRQPFALAQSESVESLSFGPLNLDGAKRYYFFALGSLVVAMWLASRVRSGGAGRLFIALRDNEDAARAFCVRAVWRKLQAFAVSGFLAGFSGAVFAFALTSVSYASFVPTLSIDVVAMTLIGGIGILSGPLVGALYIFGLPEFLHTRLDAVAVATSAAGWLVLILYVPGGLAALVAPLRNRIADAIAARSGIDVAAARAGEEVSKREEETLTVPPRALEARAAKRKPTKAVLLKVRSLSKTYGGVSALDDVDLDVLDGETLGLIGPNGAGKTTLFEVISGFVRPDDGTIVFDDRHLSQETRIELPGTRSVRLQRALSPEARGRLGLIRSFQDTLLFPTMTVEDVLVVALERSAPTELLASIAGLSTRERKKRERAAELVSMMGLGAFRTKQVRELSTGTRRIVEIGCLVAMEPRLLLLDEPSSGIAQRETEKLGELLGNVKRHLGCTLVLIEHDIPLVSALSDRMVAMESGRIIASGTPDEVRATPAVIESYLGTDATTIQRSGSAKIKV